MNARTPIAVLSLFLLFAVPTSAQGPYFQHQLIELDFEIEATREKAPENPFTDYRLQVTFTQGPHRYSVPGFYAADGDAAQTSAEAGGIWRVRFTPPRAGAWAYRVAFQKGREIALQEDPYTGIPIAPHHGKTGTFTVQEPPADAAHFERSGSLQYQSSRYLHTQDGEPLLIFGTNSPENFLAYADIDNTYAIDSNKNFIKTWSPHLGDWKPGDPTWKDGKGKGIIGALNYLAEKEMNALYLLTLNIGGDAGDVWPFISHRRADFRRYDVSKLAQWDIIFRHAERLGIVIEAITQEQENQLLLDDGYTLSERKLYYRELIARFAYHNNIIWNIGEENGYAGSWPHGQNDQQRYAMIRYLKENDPYRHPVLVHTYPYEAERAEILNPLLKYDPLDGLSMQIGEPGQVHATIRRWVEKARQRHPWIVLMDEIGPWHTGTKPDRLDPQHTKDRTTVLWPALMAGAAGVQWYFGWLTPPHDLNAEDLRSRDNMWEQSAHARAFFEQLNYTDMRSADHLTGRGDNHCLALEGATYAIYLKYGSTTQLDLRQAEGNYTVAWFNPRAGGALQTGTVKTIKGGGWADIGLAPEAPYEDWAVLIQRVAL